MTRVQLALALAILVTLASTASVAQTTAQSAPSSPLRIELGDGVAVERCALPPTVYQVPQCWTPIGFRIDTYRVVGLARTFARTPIGAHHGGRLFAAIVDNASLQGHGRMAPVVYTDDLGARWEEALWDPRTGSPTLGAYSPLALSVEPTGDVVVAVGEYGRLWVSHDGGASFVQRRRGGQSYLAVETLGRAIVMADVDGRVTLTTDDGRSLRTLASERGAIVARETDAIVVRAGDRLLRIDREGTSR